MSSRLTVTETIEGLHRLEAALRAYSASEQKLQRELQTKIAASERLFKQQIETREREVADEIERQNASASARRQRLQAIYDQRMAQISKAHHSSKRQGLDWIGNQEGRRKYPLQKELLETERHRVDGLKERDAALETFRAEVAETRAALTLVEGEVQKAFRGYSGFARRLAETGTASDAELVGDENQLLDELRQIAPKVQGDVAKFRSLLLPKVFRNVPLGWWIALLVACAAAGSPLLTFLAVDNITAEELAWGAAVALGLILLLYLFSRQQANPVASSIIRALQRARRLHDTSLEKAEKRHAQESARIENEANARKEKLEREWQTTGEEAAGLRETLPSRVDEKCWRLSVKTDQLYRDKIDRLECEHRASIEILKRDHAAWKQETSNARQAKLTSLQAGYDAQQREERRKFQDEVQSLYNTFGQASATAEEDFPPWDPALWRQWKPPTTFATAARFAEARLDLRKCTEEPLPLPIPSDLSVPLVLRYPQQGSLLLETNGAGNEAAVATLNAIMLRLLATSPAGKLSFTIIDPVKLGQNFAAIMHLADHEDSLIHGKIWTEPNQIEERLSELNQHMEKVIQNYLRNEYTTIAEYNVEAGNIAEKYHFLVVADFPANFSEVAIRRLLRITESGARCGVFTLIHWNHRMATTHAELIEDLRKGAVCLVNENSRWTLKEPALSQGKIVLETPPDAQFTTAFLRQVGEASRGSGRVEVPFTEVAPEPEKTWTATTREELRVPIGRSGATKLQQLAIGKGTRQHVLIAGKTGSGKSTLFHVVITNLALWCSPDEVEFYLVDFKKGVEFKCYAAHRLPHARVVAIESDREFGLSVLQRLDDELKRRGDLFRKAGVQDLAGYRRTSAAEPMPRCLLMIDEFQEFFVEDDRISQAANMLLDRIVRQGRAFGIHVLLGSQTLGGAYTLARSTLGQMVVRIALQCNEADAYLIMDENNPAPRLLSRPGEGIYNDMAGAVEANSPFQAVWLSDQERDTLLARIHRLGTERNMAEKAPIVFEGNAPADIADNPLLQPLLHARLMEPVMSPRIWLGAPNSIKGPTEAVFQRRSGSNLLIVGQRDEATLAMLSIGLFTLAAQYPNDSARLIFCDSSLPGSPERDFADRISRMTPGEIELIQNGDIAGLIGALAEDLQKRIDGGRSENRPTFLFIRGLQHFKKLKVDDEFSFGGDAGANLAGQFRTLITEGPGHGIHVIVSVDNYNNVVRFLGRKALSDFEMRVLFQMSANDSSALCDDPKASNLGLHRALFYNEQQGHLETFRPYALPSPEWFEDAGRHLGRNLQAAAR